MGQIIYGEYIVFRGSNISCSLATTGAAAELVLSKARISQSFETEGYLPSPFFLVPPSCYPGFGSNASLHVIHC